MNPSYISLGFLLVMIPLLITGQIMPALNLHIASDREALIRQETERVLFKTLRVTQESEALSKSLLAMKLPGLKIETAAITTDGEFVLAQLSYRYSELFMTKFFQTNKSKTIQVVAVRVD